MGSNEKAFAIIVLCGIIGVIFAIIVQLLYEQNIIITELLSGSGFALREIQFIIILIWEIIGIVVAALES